MFVWDKNTSSQERTDYRLQGSLISGSRFELARSVAAETQCLSPDFRRSATFLPQGRPGLNAVAGPNGSLEYPGDDQRDEDE